MSTIGRRSRLTCMIAAIVGVFAYSVFINIQREKNPNAEKSVGD
jgi:uncharacterized short protein YbdD (DUF466 family)